MKKINKQRIHRAMKRVKADYVGNWAGQHDIVRPSPYRPVLRPLSERQPRTSECDIDSTLMDVSIVDARKGIPLGRAWLDLIIDRHTHKILSCTTRLAGKDANA